ncbi:hypothetical protein GGI05_001228 [Coemansia sp. RSA 2603]|nr:hypothetical protein GGI05_001228 [Coemansia sp. RSA 2603]
MLAITNRSNELINIRVKGHVSNDVVTGATMQPGLTLTLKKPAYTVVKVAIFSSKGTLGIRCNATETTIVDIYLDKPVYIQKSISNNENLAVLKDFIPVVSLKQLDDPNFSFDTVYDLVEPYEGTVRVVQFNRRSYYGRTGLLY